MAEDENRESESTPKKKSKLPLIIILVVVLLLAGGGFVAVKMFILKPAPEVQDNPDAAFEEPVQPQRQTNAKAEPGPMVAYPSFIVNLADPGGNRYLKVTLSIELSKDKNFEAEVASKEPKIKDIMISVLSSKTFEEISTTQGKIALKQEILRRLNTIMSGGRVVDVFITEFVIQ